MNKLAEVFHFGPHHKSTSGQQKKIKGFVVLQKKNVLDFSDFGADILDDLSELIGKGVSFQLVSTSQIDSSSGNGKFGEKALLQNWISTPERLVTGQTTYNIDFDWDSDFGPPGAVFITNSHHDEFFLNSLTLEVPHHGNVHFDCNSWVYPASADNRGRIFFSNRSYLPSNCPPALIKLRSEDLISLRGEYDGMAETERKEKDRVYDYDFYNDLGDPDKSVELSRPVLGGSQQFPYPRRGRTGRPPTKTEPATESRLSLDMSLDIYVPRDERFGHLKMSDFLGNALKSVVQFLIPELQSLFDPTRNEFDSFEDIIKLYSDGIKLPDNPILDAITTLIPLELIKDFLTTDGEKLLKYPLPQVIATDEFALAQSVKTSLFEELIASTIDTCKDIPAQIANTGTIALSRTEINMQIGELFILRINIHLNGSVLDTPELFWVEPQLEPVYQAVRSYLEMDQRVGLLTQRLDVIADLLAVLKEQLSHGHGEKLEWIVIILIAAEILVAAINIVVDLYAGV